MKSFTAGFNIFVIISVALTEFSRKSLHKRPSVELYKAEDFYGLFLIGFFPGGRQELKDEIGIKKPELKENT